jgi:hypothetical protein
MFTHYAQIENGVVVAYPIDPHKIIDGVITPTANWLGGEFEGNTYAFCHDERPSITHTQDLVEIAPAFDPVRECWYRQYTIVSASDEVVAERSAKQILAIEETSADIIKGVDLVLLEKLTDSDRALWVAFRDQILAVSATPISPWDIVWPIPPENTSANWNGPKIDIGVTRV